MQTTASRGRQSLTVFSSILCFLFLLVFQSSDNTYLATLQASQRGEGFNCRCMKD
ncbi:MAG TPA: hypothetical protein VK489_04685 [Ferruginibacter sp.]|nr:hypothetical protein [Ferruginibacter sp.]